VATVAGIALGAVEAAAGVALFARPELAAVAVDLMVTVLCIGFVVVVATARRRGAACGCFGSFSPGISGAAESARATTLALTAGATTLMRRGGHGPAQPLAIGTAAAAALVVTLATTWRHGHGRRSSIVQRLFADRDPHPPADGWRWAGPWERHRLLRVIRRNPAVTEVVERTPWIRWSWRHARVTLTTDEGRIASVVVPAPSALLRVLAPEAGSPAVVGYTSRGVYVPKCSRYDRICVAADT
jgi:hypothetical protein